MDLNEAIYTRRAVRDFTVEVVAETTIRQMIDAAIQAPSAVNGQPWSFCVVRDKVLLTRISREAKAHMLRAPRPGQKSEHFDKLLNDPNFDIFYDATVLIVISAIAESMLAEEDCSLAAENLMLAAHACEPPMLRHVEAYSRYQRAHRRGGGRSGPQCHHSPIAARA